MQFLGRTNPRRLRVQAVLTVIMLVLTTTGCEWIKGRPDVERIDVSVQPDTIVEGEAAQAIGLARDDGGSTISSAKVRVRYSSSDASIATVNPENGVVTGIAPGTTEIFGEAQGKRGSAEVTVVFAPPATIVTVPQVLTPIIGTPVTLTVEPRKANGQPLTGRTAQFTAVNPLLVSVTQTGPLTATVNGIAIGATEIIVSIGVVQQRVVVSVRPTPIAAITGRLQNGTDAIQIGEVMQIVLSARDASGAPVVTAGRNITFESDNNAVATVSNSGIITGVREGTARITILADGVRGNPELVVRVVPKRVDALQFGGTSVILRVGGVRVIQATAIDSAGQAVPGRQVGYTTTDATIATVNPTSGLVTPREVGSTQLIATLESLADTITLQVTPIPIVSVRVDPAQHIATTGQTRQFTASLTDSTGRVVTGRTINWQTNNTEIATVDQTGLATAGRAGTVQVIAFVDEVPGFPTRRSGAADLVVRPIEIARVEVTPATTQVRVGQRTFVTIRAFDTNGRELFGRGGSIAVTPADPSVANGDQAGAITGLKAGSTTIVYQAVDATGLAQGTPATVTVTVTQ
jgi:uncharacterized protein YjdB